jgi:hypothetical protein
LEVAFHRLSPDGDVQSTTARFFSDLNNISQPEEFNTHDLIVTFTRRIEDFNLRGSNWVFDDIVTFKICCAPYRSAQGSSYFMSPEEILNKMCCMNVKNNDQKCFIWSVLAHIYPAQRDADRTTKYVQYMGTLNDNYAVDMLLQFIATDNHQNSGSIFRL